MMLGKLYPKSSILGIDAHNFSVTSAQNNLANYRLLHPQDPLSNVQFKLCPVNEMPQIENSYDIITTTFVNHHIFPDEEFINFLRYVRRVGKKAFIFNDLYRSVPSYVMSYLFTNLLRNETAPYLCSFLETVQIVLPLDLVSVALQAARVLSNRPATHLLIESGLKSIEKSFTVTELKEMFNLAGYPESALQCDYFFVPGRVVCYADLE
jgi:ubiquinone/menaquinone biosynthesis C-methylase UbiE